MDILSIVLLICVIVSIPCADVLFSSLYNFSLPCSYCRFTYCAVLCVALFSVYIAGFVYYDVRVYCSVPVYGFLVPYLEFMACYFHFIGLIKTFYMIMNQTSRISNAV